MYKWIFSLIVLFFSIPTEAYMEAKDCSYHFDIEWLFWEAEQDNITGGTFIDDHPGTLKTVKAETITPKFQYNSGVRLNANYLIPCSCYEVGATFAYLPIRSSSQKVNAAGIINPSHGELIAFNLNSFPAATAVVSTLMTSLFNEWKGDFFYADLDLRRELTYGSCFHISPHMGIRGVWMKQNFEISGNLFGTGLNGSTFVDFNVIQKSQSYGIEGGFWIFWDICPRLRMLGHIGGSLLSSVFTGHQDTKGYVGEGGRLVADIDVIFDARNTFNQTFEYFLGIQYASCICSYPYILHAGWEQRTYLNMNHFAVNAGNLSFQGLTFGLGLYF